MDLTTIEDDDDVEVTEEILSFHSNVRENIVRFLLKALNWILSNLDIWVNRPRLKFIRQQASPPAISNFFGTRQS